MKNQLRIGISFGIGIELGIGMVAQPDNNVMARSIKLMVMIMYMYV